MSNIHKKVDAVCAKVDSLSRRMDGLSRKDAGKGATPSYYERGIKANRPSFEIEMQKKLKEQEQISRKNKFKGPEHEAAEKEYVKLSRELSKFWEGEKQRYLSGTGERPWFIRGKDEPGRD